jgi:hypothetical protein
MTAAVKLTLWMILVLSLLDLTVTCTGTMTSRMMVTLRQLGLTFDCSGLVCISCYAPGNLVCLSLDVRCSAMSTGLDWSRSVTMQRSLSLDALVTSFGFHSSN